MAIKPLDWYCQPVANGVWGSVVSNALGAFTPCATQSVVGGVSYLLLICLCVYRIWLTCKDLTVKKYSLRSKYYNYFLGFLAAYCTAEPFVRLIMRISVFNLDGQAGLAPYEVVSLIIESLAWLSVLIMIGVENKVYICEFRWFVRFALIYALVGDAVMLNLVISVKEYYERSVLYLYLSEVVIQERNRCRLELNLQKPDYIGKVVKQLVIIRLRGCISAPARISDKEWLQRIGIIASDFCLCN